MAITTNATAITFNDNTIQTTAGKTGTVTSVATGNGLSGGTITTTGTISIAAPAANSVGSYALVVYQTPFFGPHNITFGDIIAPTDSWALDNSFAVVSGGTVLSGTWRWLAQTTAMFTGYSAYGFAVRIA